MPKMNRRDFHIGSIGALISSILAGGGSAAAPHPAIYSYDPNEIELLMPNGVLPYKTLEFQKQFGLANKDGLARYVTVKGGDGDEKIAGAIFYRPDKEKRFLRIVIAAAYPDLIIAMEKKKGEIGAISVKSRVPGVETCLKKPDTSEIRGFPPFSRLNYNESIVNYSGPSLEVLMREGKIKSAPQILINTDGDSVTTHGAVQIALVGSPSGIYPHYGVDNREVTIGIAAGRTAKAIDTQVVQISDKGGNSTNIICLSQDTRNMGSAGISIAPIRKTMGNNGAEFGPGIQLLLDEDGKNRGQYQWILPAERLARAIEGVMKERS